MLLVSAAYAGETDARYEPALKAAAKLNPESFEANYNLGEFYLHAGRLPDGMPYMEQALRLQPSHFAGGYDLALAYYETKEYPKARNLIKGMLDRGDSADLHLLLADVEEASGNFVVAAQEFQRAAQIDPSEENLFAWGSELLAHQTYDPAVLVFTRSVELNPKSAKLAVGLGIALYFKGNVDEAVKVLWAATDRQPSESWPYLLLGKIYTASGANSEEAGKRLARFARLQPKNARALYYFAMTLKAQNPEKGLPEMQALLKQAIAEDPSFSDAHFQLGVLFMNQRKYPEAIQEFNRAVAIQPSLTKAHYSLLQIYSRTGDKTGSERELLAFEAARKQDQAEEEKNRAEIRQFVLDIKDQPSGVHPPQ